MVSDIGSHAELKRAMADVELRTWYAEKRLAEGSREFFSVDNLLSSFVPDGAMNGIAVVKGLLSTWRKLRSGRYYRDDGPMGC